MAKNNISLTLDTQAPSISSFKAGTAGSIIMTNQDISLSLSYTHPASQGSSVFMKSWYSTSVEGTKEDPGYINGTWETASSTVTTKFVSVATPGNYYYHIVLSDDVGNETAVSTATASDGSTPVAIIFDNEAPVITANSLKISDPDGDDTTKYIYTNNLENDLEVAFSDSYSGVVELHLFGQGESASYVVEKTVALLPTDTSKTTKITLRDVPDGTTVQVSATVTDGAGNVSAVAVSNGIIYTASTGSCELIISQPDDSGLNPYINYTNVKAKIKMTSAGIVAYKIWGDFATSATSEAAANWVYKNSSDHTDAWSLNTVVSVGAITITETNGNKNFYAKVMDAAGNVSEASIVSTFLDTQAPDSTTVSVATSTGMISKVSGHDTATITYSIGDKTKDGVASDIASWQIYCNNSSINTGTVAVSSATQAITSSTTGMVEGNNLIKITATDKAGNSYTTNTITITLDTKIPAVTNVTGVPSYTNNKFDITVSSTDNADSTTGVGVDVLYTWIDNVQTSTRPTAVVGVQVTSSTTSVAANQVYFVTPESAVTGDTYYIHVQAIDKVGNASEIYNKSFVYDNVVPAGTIAFSAAGYSSTSANVIIYLNNSNPTGQSPIVKYKVSGDIAAGGSITPDTWIDLSQAEQAGTQISKSITLSSGDGMKTISVYLQDAAGNQQSVAGTASCELDTKSPWASLTLRNAGQTSQKDDPSNIPDADAYIEYKDDEASSTTPVGKVYFKIWGNYSWNSATLPTTEAGAEWIEVNTDNVGTITELTDNKKAFTLPLVATSSEDVKSVYVRFKDDGGNIFPALNQDPIFASFTYDTTAIIVRAEDPDYNRLSTVHSLRSGSSTKYNDMSTFTFYPTLDGTTASTEHYIEYKVCAYEDETAAKAVTNVALEPAIGTANGSQNTSWSGGATSGQITCVIAGRDLEIALGASEAGTHAKDGTHVIVAYIKDAAGTWSGICQTYTI